jgi:RNA recognition motif-containing protein
MDCGRYQDSGRAMGYAHVDFATPSAAEAAVALDGKFMMGRFLNVEFAREKKTQKGPALVLCSCGPVDETKCTLRFADVASSIGPRPASCTTLYVRNLPYDTDEEAVSEVFK